MPAHVPRETERCHESLPPSVREVPASPASRAMAWPPLAPTGRPLGKVTRRSPATTAGPASLMRKAPPSSALVGVQRLDDRLDDVVHVDHVRGRVGITSQHQPVLAQRLQRTHREGARERAVDARGSQRDRRAGPACRLVHRLLGEILRASVVRRRFPDRAARSHQGEPAPGSPCTAMLLMCTNRRTSAAERGLRRRRACRPLSPRTRLPAASPCPPRNARPRRSPVTARCHVVRRAHVAERDVDRKPRKPCGTARPAHERPHVPLRRCGAGTRPARQPRNPPAPVTSTRGARPVAMAGAARQRLASRARPCLHPRLGRACGATG